MAVTTIFCYQLSLSEVVAKIKPSDSYHNLWDEISNNHSLSGYERDNGLYWHIKWFKENTDYLTRVTARAQPYLKIILDEVKRRKLPYEIALLPIVESAFYPFSYSHGTASGLWQFIPSTAKLYGLKQNYWIDERRDIVKSTNAALNYLENLYILFKDWPLAIAAYNAGPGRVQKAIAHNKKLGRKTDFWNIDIPSETRGYFPRLLAVAKLIKYPQRYNQKITPIYNNKVVDSIYLDNQLDIALIQEFSGLSIDKIYELNPALNRFATPPHYNLLLPTDSIARFNKNLHNYPLDKRIRWFRHKIKEGDSVILVANKYNIDKNVLIQLNNIKNNKIIVGDYLLIPLSQRNLSFYSRSLDNIEIKRLANDSENKIIYTVVKGDSLWGIANKFKVKVDDIIIWNKLLSTTLINIGDKIVIYKQKPLKISSLVKTTQIKPNIVRNIDYIVKKGDSLWSIANKFKVRIADIIKINKLNKNSLLIPGKKINIEVDIIND